MPSINIRNKIILIIVASIAISLGAFFGVKAAGYNGTIFGLPAYTGYFKGIKDSGNADRVIEGGIPSNIDSANDFMYFIQTTNYNNGSVQDKTGAAFIVNAMLGKHKPGNTKNINISPAVWTEFFNMLKALENDNRIDWYADIDNAGDGINSYYQRNQQDNAFYSAGRTGPGIVFKNKDGTSFQLLKACANPIGELSSIVPEFWIANVTVGVDKSTALPGDVITWSHKTWITNGVSDKAVVHSWQNSGDFGSGSGVLETLAVPTNPGDRPIKLSPSYTVLAGDIGKRLCRRTIATPLSSTDGSTISSEDSCVSIGVASATGPCRPIIVSVGSHSDVDGGAVAIAVKLTNNSTGATINKGSYTSAQDINVTTICTTGDVWTASFDIARHIESKTAVDRRKCSERNSSGKCTDWEWVFDHWDYTYDDPSATSNDFGPCYDYLLKPNIQDFGTGGRPFRIEVDSSITITPNIQTDSWTKNNLIPFWNTYRTQTKSKVSQWQVSRVVVAPNVEVPVLNITNVSVDPCAYYNSKGFKNCKSLSSGSDTVFNNNSVLSGSNAFNSVVDRIIDEPAGSKICYVFSVKSSDSENSNSSSNIGSVWSHSAISSNECAIIVKKPKVQILGGDLSVGKASTSSGNIATTTSVKTFSGSYVFGSWAEYGVMARGTISGLGSAAAFNGGLPGANVGLNCQYSRLSFNNRCSSSTSSSPVGNYNFGSQTIPDISKSFPRQDSTPKLPSSFSVDYFNTSAYNVFTTNGDITITGGTLNKARWAVINSPDATVTISGDIRYTAGTLNSINDIPQLVIIAKNINIQNSATQIDAWLIAKDGYINTCSDVGVNDRLTASMCRFPLTINGPVVSKSLYLRRTAGSNPGQASSGSPAETLNLRADAYLWSYARATGTGRVWTVYTTNVPPRL